jgi:UDP-N-acetylmuramate: L-alanyl-gamma-D-glutamyl-meso-diaminopimelate ligase
LQDRYDRSEHLYLLPIGGTAMAPLAGLLHELGHRVEGVDAQLYPPMSTLLETLEIPVRIGFDPARLDLGVDRVIIGNAVPRTNPEVAAVLAAGLPYISQAEAVAHYVLARGQDSVVVAGTHGKTTTTAMVAWILEDCQRDPSSLIGGMPLWSQRPYRLGAGGQLVIEGDEYNTAFFDRGPKFLHYRPHLFLLGPVEFDHGDVYRDLDGVVTAFRAGAAQVPGHGAVIVNTYSAHAVDSVRDATAPVITVGPDAGCDLRLSQLEVTGHPGHATIQWRGESATLTVPMAGAHNLHNGAMAVAAAVSCGVELADAVDSLARFPGVARRQHVVGEAAGITVVDDFAHHPTALAATIAAARQRWAGRRLVVAFEPRSITAARKDFQPAYLDALAGAELVLVMPPFHRGRLAAAEVLDRDWLARELEARGVAAIMPESDDDPVAMLLPRLAGGDVVVGCSSGSFDGFHGRLLDALEAATIEP